MGEAETFPHASFLIRDSERARAFVRDPHGNLVELWGP